MKPHKWAKEIKAWADGAEIEVRFKEQPTFKSEGFWTEWEPMTSNYRFSEDDWWEYRIKPQPCVNEEEPRGCYRVRCQLGKKCVDDEMSHRLPQPKEPQYLYVYADFRGDLQITDNTEYANSHKVFGKIKLEVDDENN